MQQRKVTLNKAQHWVVLLLLCHRNHLTTSPFQTSISARLQHPSRLSWDKRNIGRINGGETGRGKNIFFVEMWENKLRGVGQGDARKQK